MCTYVETNSQNDKACGGGVGARRGCNAPVSGRSNNKIAENGSAVMQQKILQDNKPA